MQSGNEYGNFADLSNREIEGIDYRIYLKKTGSGILFMAPHGGKIEPGTSEIARALASDRHSCYCFEGIKPAGNRRLHIASTRFDEPVWEAVARESCFIVALHGCKGSDELIYIGGHGSRLKNETHAALAQADFKVSERPGLLGLNPSNVCNRESGRAGIQLELTAALRQTMLEDFEEAGERPADLLARFVTAVETAISCIQPRRS